RFVDSQLGNGRPVVCRRERGDLPLCTGGRTARNRVRRGQTPVERTRRIADRQRDSALEFRHRNDLGRRVGQRDQVLLAHEIGRLRERGFPRRPPPFGAGGG